MKIKSAMAFLSPCLAIFLGAMPATGQPADQEKLEQIDRAFVCPESLPNVKAKEDSLREFTNQLAAAWPSVTIDQLVKFRFSLLERHQCTQTLDAIRRNSQGSSKPPG